MKKITKEYIEKVRKLYFNFVEEIKLFILLALFAMVSGIFFRPIMTEIEYLMYIRAVYIIFEFLLKILILIYLILFLINIIVFLKNYLNKKNGNK